MAGAKVVELTADNVEAVLALDEGEQPHGWVRPVAWYVARSAYQQVWAPVAFAVDGEIIAFAEWAYDETDGIHWLGGVVVDARQRGKGYGRAVMTSLLALLRTQPRFRAAGLTVHPGNEVALGLYRSLGFRETGEVVDGELVLVRPED